MDSYVQHLTEESENGWIGEIKLFYLKNFSSFLMPPVRQKATTVSPG